MVRLQAPKPRTPNDRHERFNTRLNPEFLRAAHMKRKSPGRLKSNLSKKLLPKLDLAILAHDIAEFLNKPAGKAARGKDLANILAAYLAQKYSITDRKRGQLCGLIEDHSDDLAGFLDKIRFKEFQALVGWRPQPISSKDWL